MLGAWQIPLTDGRRGQLHQTWEGLQRTGHYLVLYDGSSLGPAPWQDDSGLFLFAPVVARVLHVSVDTAATIVLAGSLALALALGVFAWWRFARTGAGKALGAAAYVVLGALTLAIGDTYAIASALTLGLVPWLLLAARARATETRWALLLGGAGLVIGIGQLVRTGAGVHVLVLAAALVATLELRWWRRALLLVVLALGLVLPGRAMRAGLARRDAYLADIVPGYQPPSGVHPFWHAIYAGQGYVANDRGLYYNDTVPTEHARRVEPGIQYMSPRYEAVVRGLVLGLVRAEPMLVIKNEAAKAGVLGFYFLVFANVGIWAAIARRKAWRLDLALGAGIAAAALPGLLVIPDFRFIFGFTTLSALFGLASLDGALARGWPLVGLARTGQGATAMPPGEAVP